MPRCGSRRDGARAAGAGRWRRGRGIGSSRCQPARAGSGRYEVAYGGRYCERAVRCAPAIQEANSRLRHDPARVGHVAVPEPAELGAADVERARALELDVDDVVDAGVRVGLDAELVGPEGMDDVQRGDVEPDQPVRGQHELGVSTPPYARVAIGERPLLADHLDVHRLASFRPGANAAEGPWPPPAPSWTSS